METLTIKNSNLELPELVEKLREFDALKNDLVMNSDNLTVSNGEINFSNISEDGVINLNIKPNPFMHRQIADKLGIPFKYYERMQNEYKDLLDHNVASWFMKNKKNYLFRTYQSPGGELYGRAMLSDSFKIIDHLDILMVTLQAINEEGLKGIKVDQADITETSMYVRFINEEAKVSGKQFLENYRNPETLEVNDGIVSGFVLKNSETGQGALQVAPRAKILVCGNGMVQEKDAYRRTHLGAKLDEGRIDWSNQTKEANHSLIKSQIKDYVKHFSSKDYLQKVVDDINHKGNQDLTNPVEAVKNATKYCEIPESNQNDILNYFMRSGDSKASGVVQAITYYAHSQGDADTRYELEAKSMDVLDNIRQFDVNPN